MHNTGQADEISKMLDALGTVGWEAVGVTAVDKTIGLNSIMVLLKREQIGLPRPAETSPGRKFDPTGRYKLRAWDGLRWERHVSNDGGATSTVDLPV